MKVLFAQVVSAVLGKAADWLLLAVAYVEDWAGIGLPISWPGSADE